MVTKRTTRPPEPLVDHSKSRTHYAQQQSAECHGVMHSSDFRQPLKRYGTYALTLSVAAGGLMMMAGQIPLGKGLIFGALFSIINFALMAVALPMRLGHRRGPSTLISLASIAVRYALLAIPLIIAVSYSQFAVSSTAAGLFMVQLTILVDQVWGGRRHLLGTEE